MLCMTQTVSARQEPNGPEREAVRQAKPDLRLLFVIATEQSFGRRAKRLFALEWPRFSRHADSAKHSARTLVDTRPCRRQTQVVLDDSFAADCAEERNGTIARLESLG